MNRQSNEQEDIPVFDEEQEDIPVFEVPDVKRVYAGKFSMHNMTEYEKKKVYTNQGYKSRVHYHQTLARDYKVCLIKVVKAAKILGKEEDFDGLLVTLEKYCT